MAYDPDTGQLVLFGGGDGIGGTANDTWTWNGTTWTRQLQSSPSPSGRDSASMAYDTNTGQLVLFGGFGSSFGVYPDDTWNWNGTEWTQLNPATSPPGRGSAAMAYDPDTAQLVLFSGYSEPNVLNDTWDWNGSTWAQATPPTSPSIRTGASLAYDTGTAQLVLFGGSSNSSTEHNDTWVYQPPPANTDTVAFNSDGGAAVASLSGPDGSSITLPSDSYAGYTFNGWYTAASGGTKVGGAGASYTVPVGGITLFAQWTANTDTVAFNSDGGAAVASLSGPDGSSITLPSDSYAGYTFNGWYTAASGGTKVGGAGSSYTVPVGGITLYAQWTANTDTVAFNSDGGAAVASLSGPDGSSITLPSDSYAGYTFNGWYTAASGGTKVGGAGSSYTVPVGGITLYAQWTANTPAPTPPPTHGYWLVGPTGASSPSAGPSSTAPRATCTCSARSWASRPRRIEPATGWWHRTAVCSPSGTPAFTDRFPDWVSPRPVRRAV